MDLNLDTLKREILEYLEAAGLAVFHSTPGGLEGLPLVLWDTEHHPDYQMFLEAAQKVGAKLILFAARDFEPSDVDDLLRTARRVRSRHATSSAIMSRRLREMRIFEGVTCSLELAFDYNSRLYVYEVQPDWYEEFLGIEDESRARAWR